MNRATLLTAILSLVVAMVALLAPAQLGDDSSSLDAGVESVGTASASTQSTDATRAAAATEPNEADADLAEAAAPTDVDSVVADAAVADVQTVTTSSTVVVATSDSPVGAAGGTDAPPSTVETSTPATTVPAPATSEPSTDGADTIDDTTPTTSPSDTTSTTTSLAPTTTAVTTTTTTITVASSTTTSSTTSAPVTTTTYEQFPDVASPPPTWIDGDCFRSASNPDWCLPIPTTTATAPVGFCAWADGSGLVGTMTRQACLDLEPDAFAYVWTTDPDLLPTKTTTTITTTTTQPTPLCNKVVWRYTWAPLASYQQDGGNSIVWSGTCGDPSEPAVPVTNCSAIHGALNTTWNCWLAPWPE